MKRYALIVAMLVVPCSMVLAENPRPVDEKVVNVGGQPGGNTAAAGWGQDAGQYIKQLDGIVTLTEDQKKEIQQISDERNKAMGDFQKSVADKSKAMSEAMVKAYQSKDQEAIAKAQQEYQALYQPMHEIMKKYTDRMDKVLTSEQKAKLHDSSINMMIKSLTHPAQLTEQQMKAVKAAVGPGDGKTVDYTAIVEAVNNILTPEQKASINKARVLPSVKYRFWAAKLTEEQMKQLEGAAEQLVKDPSLSQADLIDKLAEKANTLLTPEQKAAMEKAPKYRDVRVTQ